MKLLLCPECNDIIRLIKVPRKCRCGKTSGAYIGNIKAYYTGKGVPIGISNESLSYAVRHWPIYGDSELFRAFVIPAVCYTFIDVPEKEFEEIFNKLKSKQVSK